MTTPTSLHTRTARLFAAVLILVGFITPIAFAKRPEQSLQQGPPKNWHLLDDSIDHIPGVSAERAFRELLVGKTPQRTVIVAVIDAGVDTAHSAFRGVMWTNSKETAGNKKDDDKNGYVDDIHGWNFLGNADGRNYEHDLSEEERVLTICRRNAVQGLPEPKIVTATMSCAEMQKQYTVRRDSLVMFATWLRATEDSLLQTTKVLRKAIGSDSITPSQVRELKSDAPAVTAAQRWWLAMGVFDQPEALIAHDSEVMTQQLKAYDGSPDPRSLVGDHYDNLDEHGYGNNDVRGPEPSHGTAVASVIAGQPDSGFSGIARSNVQIMSLRTVPGGDERDKDVANAIRYAVDNGANIINMSFGKHLSPGKSAVDAAVAYADKKGVLMIHAAGNDGEEITIPVEPYPNPQYLKGGNPKLWLEIGSSSWQMNEHLASDFSNFGKTRVDLFAPGEEIYSAAPGGGYVRESGTSLSAPVVTGIAAVLMSYFPKLKAQDVKEILLSSAKPIDLTVVRPGLGADSAKKVPFNQLSRSGGIVNLYEAVKLALKK